jgi:hypothetical protein
VLKFPPLKLSMTSNICHVIFYVLRCLIKEIPIQYFYINTISYAVNLINFIIITFDVIEQRMSEVRKGTSRNTGNENKRCKIFNKVLNMNWDYVRGKNRPCDLDLLPMTLKINRVPDSQ